MLVPCGQHRETLCLQDPVLTPDFPALLTHAQVVAQRRHLAACQRAGGSTCGELNESIVSAHIVVAMGHPRCSGAISCPELGGKPPERSMLSPSLSGGRIVPLSGIGTGTCPDLGGHPKPAIEGHFKTGQR